MKKYIALVLSISFLASPSTFAGDKETAGTIIGGILGGILGGKTGEKGKDNTGRVIVGGLIGGLIGNRIGADMDRKDREAYERTSRECFDGPVGRDMNWQGNRYHGNVRSTREGYYNGRNGRQVCREFHSEIYRDQSTEVVDGVVCKGPNGWEKVERREVRFDDGMTTIGGPINQGPIINDRRDDRDHRQNIQYDLGILSPVSRRTGGEYLSLILAGKNLSSISLQSTGNKIRIYRVFATTSIGSQVQLNSLMMNTFMYMGNSMDLDLSGIQGSVTRLDILVEAWDSNLGIIVKGRASQLQPPVVTEPVRPIPPPVVYEPAPYQVRVCDEVARQNSFNGSQCVQSIAGKYMDPNADRVCASMATQNSFNASQCAAYAAGARFSAAGLQVCEAVGRQNAFNGSQCVEKIANKRIDERFVQGCITTAQSNSYNGAQCVENLIIGDL